MEYVLAHHGVKGMRWGVRKERESSVRKRVFGSDSGPKKKTKKRLIDNELVRVGIIAASSALIAHKLTSVAKMRNNESTLSNGKKIAESFLSDISDKDLKSKVDRLTLERQYKSLSNEKSSNSESGDLSNKIAKITNSLANWSTSAITLYNNYEKIKKIIESRE